MPEEERSEQEQPNIISPRVKQFVKELQYIKEQLGEEWTPGYVLDVARQAGVTAH